MAESFWLDLSDLGSNPYALYNKATREMGLPFPQLNFAVCGRNSTCRRNFIASMRLTNDHHRAVLYHNVPLPSSVENARDFYVNERLYGYAFIFIVSSGKFHDVEKQLAAEAFRRNHTPAMVIVDADQAIREIALRENKSMKDSALELRLQLQQDIRDYIEEGFLFLISCPALQSPNFHTCYMLLTNGCTDDSLPCMDEALLSSQVRNLFLAYIAGIFNPLLSLVKPFMIWILKIGAVAAIAIAFLALLAKLLVSWIFKNGVVAAMLIALKLGALAAIAVVIVSVLFYLFLYPFLKLQIFSPLPVP